MKPPPHPWLRRLGTLNVSRSQSRGPAPHKPLMLLTVIDLIESGEIGAEGWVDYGPELVAPFRDYWELVLDRQRNAPEVAMPFHALGGERDQVWERFTEEGAPSGAKATTRRCRLDPGVGVFGVAWGSFKALLRQREDDTSRDVRDTL